MSKNMTVRIISGVFLLIGCIFFQLVGGPLLLLVLLFCSEVGLFEFYRATGVCNENGKHSLIENIGYAGAAVYYAAALFVRSNSIVALILILCVVLVAMLAAYVLTFPRYSGDLILPVQVTTER